MADYKQLCAKILAYNEGQGKYNFSHLNAYDRDNAAFDAWQDIKTELKSALAEPEPEWPTDEEIMELMPQQMRDDLAAASRALSGFDPDNIKAASVFRIILNRHSVDHSRAVLARWGNHPALQPVSVSERLPGPGDCDAEGRCWWWYPEVSGKTYGYWANEDNAVPERALDEQPSHWLPAHALPVPSYD